MTAAEAIEEAKKLVDAFGWPAYSPMQALKAIEKKMPEACPQMQLMWTICVREAVRRRKNYSGLHPIIEIHVQDGQTKAGIEEYLLDCIDQAKHHPLNEEPGDQPRANPETP